MTSPRQDRRRDLAAAGPAGEGQRRNRRTRGPRTLGLVVGSLALAALLFVFVLPTRTYLSQRQSLRATEARLRLFEDQNAKLAADAKALSTDAEIERIARQQYGLVKPGEQPFVVLPPAPRAASPNARKKGQPGLLSRTWHDIQFWN